MQSTVLKCKQAVYVVCILCMGYLLYNVHAILILLLSMHAKIYMKNDYIIVNIFFNHAVPDTLINSPPLLIIHVPIVFRCH